MAGRVQAVVENARNALALLSRAPVVPADRLVARRQRYRVIAILAALAVVASMFFIDERAYRLALRLPMGVVDAFYEITDFGRSGWVLVPTGALIAVMALVASPALDHMTRGVLASDRHSCWVRVPRGRRSRTLRRHRQALHRQGAAISRGSLRL